MTGGVDKLIAQARKEPLGTDISDYSDEFCVGFLAGQANALEEIAAGRVAWPPLVAVEAREKQLVALARLVVAAAEGKPGFTYTEMIALARAGVAAVGENPADSKERA